MPRLFRHVSGGGQYKILSYLKRCSMFSLIILFILLFSLIICYLNNDYSIQNLVIFFGTTIYLGFNGLCLLLFYFFCKRKIPKVTESNKNNITNTMNADKAETSPDFTLSINWKYNQNKYPIPAILEIPTKIIHAIFTVLIISPTSSPNVICFSLTNKFLSVIKNENVFNKILGVCLFNHLCKFLSNLFYRGISLPIIHGGAL